MKEKATALDNIFDGTEVDEIGVVRLKAWKDTPLWKRARRLLPTAEAVIVLALEVFPEVVEHQTSQARVGGGTLRDLYNRNAELVSGEIDWEAYKIVKKLHTLGYKGLPKPASGGPFDSRFLKSALSYKEVACAAGLGVLGWHSMLITPVYGPRIRLSCVITDAPLEPTSSSNTKPPCVECDGACIKICPVSAIEKPQDNEAYRINKYTCNNYCTAAGGCSECMKVCLT